MKKRILVFSMVLALTAVMTLPMAASAAPGETVISGTIASTIVLTAPSDITFATFTVGDNLGSSTTSGSVVANGAWTMAVSATTNGYMARTTDGAQLNSRLMFSRTAGNYDTIAAYQTALQTSSGYGGATFSIPLFVKQTLLAGDAAGTYRITLTYTVTATP